MSVRFRGDPSRHVAHRPSVPHRAPTPARLRWARADAPALNRRLIDRGHDADEAASRVDEAMAAAAARRPVGVLPEAGWVDDEGFYDVQQQGLQPEFNLRGVFRTGADGRYWFRGVKPKFYPIPDDGPVGELLRELGRHPYRPAHLHYILKADGHEPLVTHIFDPSDPYIASDAVFGVKESLLAEFRWIEDPAAIEEAGMEGPFWLVDHDFALAASGSGGGGSARATTLGDPGSPA